MLLLHHTGGGHHRRQLLRNISDHVREKLLRHHGPGGTAGSKQERKLSCGNLSGVVMSFGDRSDIRAKSHFIHSGESKSFQSSLELTGSHVLAELADVGRRHDGDNIVAFPERMGKLENLGFVRDRAEGAADLTHTAGYAFVFQNTCASLFVASDGLHTAGLLAGAYIMRDRVIRTDRFAFSTFDTFLLVDDRLAVDHGNSAFGADLHTGMRHAAPAHIGDNIFIWRTGRAGRGDHLHKRRFIIFLVDIAGRKTVGKMHRLIFRAERKSMARRILSLATARSR